MLTLLKTCFWCGDGRPHNMIATGLCLIYISTVDNFPQAQEKAASFEEQAATKQEGNEQFEGTN